MIRHFVVAIVLGMGLSACGVGADEDLSTLGLELADHGAVAMSQDPVPPSPAPVTYQFATDPTGNLVVFAVASDAPSKPGGDNASSQDPIPPKVQGPRQVRQFR